MAVSRRFFTPMLFDALMVALEMVWLTILGAVELLLNASLFLVEVVMGVFVSGKKLGRVDLVGKKAFEEKRGGKKNRESKVLSTHWKILGVLFLMSLGVVMWPRLWNRSVVFRVGDGQVLSFASLVVVSKEGKEERFITNSKGRVGIPRFGTDSVRIVDPRYETQVWSQDQIGSELTVTRSVLGKSLDAVAEQVLKSFKTH